MNYSDQEYNPGPPPGVEERWTVHQSCVCGTDEKGRSGSDREMSEIAVGCRRLWQVATCQMGGGGREVAAVVVVGNN